MNILPGRRAKDFKEAAKLAFHEAGMDDLSFSVAELFAELEAANLRSEAQRSIMTAIRDKYRGNPSWDGDRWIIPVPSPGYDSRGAPQLTIDLKRYVVAAGVVETADDCHYLTLLGPIGKSEMLVIPILLLQAILDDDLSRFAVLARSVGSTTWEVPGLKPVDLPDDFLTRLSDTLRRKSVAAWLGEFGRQGRAVMPLVVGSLLGLQSLGSAKATPPGQHVWTYDQLLGALEAMAYQPGEAKAMIARAASRLNADQTLEEAIRIVLQNEGG